MLCFKPDRWPSNPSILCFVKLLLEEEKHFFQVKRSRIVITSWLPNYIISAVFCYLDFSGGHLCLTSQMIADNGGRLGLPLWRAVEPQSLLSHHLQQQQQTWLDSLYQQQQKWGAWPAEPLTDNWPAQLLHVEKAALCCCCTKQTAAQASSSKVHRTAERQRPHWTQHSHSSVRSSNTAVQCEQCVRKSDTKDNTLCATQQIAWMYIAMQTKG